MKYKVTYTGPRGPQALTVSAPDAATAAFLAGHTLSVRLVNHAADTNKDAEDLRFAWQQVCDIATVLSVVAV